MLRNHQQQAIYECGEEIGFAVLVMVVDELLKLVAHVARTHVGRVGHYRGVLAGEVAGLGEDEVGTFGQTLIEKGVLPPPPVSLRSTAPSSEGAEARAANSVGGWIREP